MSDASNIRRLLSQQAAIELLRVMVEVERAHAGISATHVVTKPVPGARGHMTITLPGRDYADHEP